MQPRHRRRASSPYAGQIASVAFDPTFVIDKSDPELKKRWATGFTRLIWRIMTVLRAQPPAVAGEPISELMLSHRERSSINGALFVLDQRSKKPDMAMNDQVLGTRLWERLEALTESPHAAP